MENIIKNIQYVCASVINTFENGDVSDMTWLQARAVEWLTEVVPAKAGFPCLKTVHIKLNSLKQAPLPQDYIKYTKIAVNYGGKLYTLGLDNSITLPENTQVCGVDTAPDNQEGVGVWFSPYVYGGQMYNAVYSIGGGFNEAYYRIDTQKHLIQLLGSVPKGEIVMEYWSSNAEANESTIIPTLWISPLRYYLFWQITDFKPSRYKAARDYMGLYEYEVREAQIADGLTLDEVMDAVYAGSAFRLTN